MVKNIIGGLIVCVGDGVGWGFDSCIVSGFVSADRNTFGIDD